MKLNRENKINPKKILQKAKIKNTSQRIVILKAISEIKHPETTKELYKKIKKDKIDLVTLYRTLASFEKKLIIKRVDLHKDAVCYELNTGHHHHIVCLDCGVVEDFEVCDKNRLIKRILTNASNFKKIKEHNLELFGVCNTCVKS